PQTDGQTERINAIIEQYLRVYCDYQQSNWADFLTMAECCHNNTVSSTTGVTPFFANYGYHPRYEIFPNQNLPLSTPEIIGDYVAQLAKLEDLLRSEMTLAQATYVEHANKRRSAPLDLKEGDEVWLLA